MERILIRNTQSPGDYIVLSAALRDLHLAHPGRFEFGIDVPETAVFLGNPNVRLHLTGGRRVVAKYPLIRQSNQNRLHFLWGFIKYLNDELHAKARLTELRPDLHLTEEERATPPPGVVKPYWTVASGGKRDFTAKWWHPVYWQQVVDRLKGRFELVQVGGGSHIHPVLTGVRNLIGKTSFRDLMRLIYHADGVLCIVTCYMHIAAAFNRPCVVVAGGREPWWWEAYTKENRLVNLRHGLPGWLPSGNDNYVEHRYLHTVDQLPCCTNKGCWRSRIEEHTHSSCITPVLTNGHRLPKCLEMITPDAVVQAVESYYGGQPIPPPPPPAPALVIAAPAIVIHTQPSVVAERITGPLRTGLWLRNNGLGVPYLQRFSALWPYRELSVFCESSTPALEQACQQLHYSLAAHPVRDQLIARLTAENTPGCVLWVEEPWLPKNPAAVQKLMSYTQLGGAWGLVAWQVLPAKLLDALAPWYQGRPWLAHPWQPLTRRAYYPGRGVWLVPGAEVQRLGHTVWSSFGEEGFELALGASLYQRHVELKDCGALFLRF